MLKIRQMTVRCSRTQESKRGGVSVSSYKNPGKTTMYLVSSFPQYDTGNYVGIQYGPLRSMALGKGVVLLLCNHSWFVVSCLCPDTFRGGRFVHFICWGLPATGATSQDVEMSTMAWPGTRLLPSCRKQAESLFSILPTSNTLRCINQL